MSQFGHILSKLNRFFQSYCKPNLCLKKLHNFNLALATKKAQLIAQVPLTHLHFPGPLLLLFLEEGKKSKRGTVIYKPLSSPLEQNLPSVTY